VAEGTSLLRMHTAYTCIVGSNPTVSAKYTFAEVQQRPKTPDLHSEAGGFLFCGVRWCPTKSGMFEGMGKGMGRSPCNLCPQKLSGTACALPTVRIVRQEEVCPS
jgi:hypothetical protein